MNHPPRQQPSNLLPVAEAPVAEASTTASQYARQPHPVSSTIALLSLMADPEPFRFRWTSKLLANEASGPNARLRVRPRLTAVCWAGDIDAAGQISDKLVDNAARHGKPFHDGCVHLHLTILPDADELRIEVVDADPAFPDFDTATAAAPQDRGLWWVQRYGAHLSWEPKVDDDGNVTGKTVSAVLRPAGQGDPA
ncbi:ATP-binding protein [Streptomyces sp. NPDC093094]|uniref:ATP-binding protein n=1 Tax=Streptomyces sp. NPDC093094 TaxID=3366026 RepID=UPI003803BE7F